MSLLRGTSIVPSQLSKNAQPSRRGTRTDTRMVTWFRLRHVPTPMTVHTLILICSLSLFLKFYMIRSDLRWQQIRFNIATSRAREVLLFWYVVPDDTSRCQRLQEYQDRLRNEWNAFTGPQIPRAALPLLLESPTVTGNTVGA
jgi:hypothetical protein